MNSMRMLVDIGHPAHVHLFRNAMRMWMNKGHQVVVVIRDKDITARLLDLYGFTYSVASVARRGTLGLAVELLEHDWGVLKLAVQNRSQLLLGSSVSITHVARLIGARSIVFSEDDADTVPTFSLLTYPFAHAIVTPVCLTKSNDKKYLGHNSYHELAYLHPNVFTPDPVVLSKLGVQLGESYFILRFVALQAAHDSGAAGLSHSMRRKLVQTLSEHGRVFITSEAPLTEEFEPYRMSISPDEIHSALYYATIFVGDSQTMTMEAAVLGTPAIRCNTFVGRCSVIEELEHRYGLTYGFFPQDEERMFAKITDLLAERNLHGQWQQKRDHMLDEKVDLTAWMVDFVEGLGASLAR